MSDDPQFDLESDALCIKLAELFDGKDIEVCVHAMIMLMSFILCDEAETKEDALSSALMIGATLPAAVESWYDSKDFIAMMN